MKLLIASAVISLAVAIPSVQLGMAPILQNTGIQVKISFSAAPPGGVDSFMDQL